MLSLIQRRTGRSNSCSVAIPTLTSQKKACKIVFIALICIAKWYRMWKSAQPTIPSTHPHCWGFGVISRIMAIFSGYFGRSRGGFLLCWRINCRSMVSGDRAINKILSQIEKYLSFCFELKNRVLTASHCIGK